MNTKPRMPRAENDTRSDWQKRLDAAVNSHSVEKSYGPDVEVPVRPMEVPENLDRVWLIYGSDGSVANITGVVELDPETLSAQLTDSEGKNLDGLFKGLEFGGEE